MSGLRILHVLDHSLPLQSGYAFRTLAILREQRALGWETLQLTTLRQQSAAAWKDVDGWRVHRTALAPLPIDRLRVISYLREMAARRGRLDELIAQFRPHVLQAHLPVLNALPALRAARKQDVPVVFELRSLWEEGAVNHGSREAIAELIAAHEANRVDGTDWLLALVSFEVWARIYLDAREPSDVTDELRAVAA